MIDITFVTSRQWKFNEVAGVLCADDAPIKLSHTGIDLDEIQSLDPADVMKHKLDAAHGAVPGSFFVDDECLICHGLNGLPGPLNKYFMNTIGAGGVYKMCHALCPDNMRATALCTLGLHHEGRDYIIEGRIEGIIVDPQFADGDNATEFRAIFLPDGHDKTYGQMDDEQFFDVGNRAVALRTLRDIILA